MVKREIMKLHNILQELNESSVSDWLKDVVKAYKKIDPAVKNVNAKTLLKQMPMNSLMSAYRRGVDPAKAARMMKPSKRGLVGR